jgi:hypothetical protein
MASTTSLRHGCGCIGSLSLRRHPTTSVLKQCSCYGKESSSEIGSGQYLLPKAIKRRGLGDPASGANQRQQRGAAQSYDKAGRRGKSPFRLCRKSSGAMPCFLSSLPSARRSLPARRAALETLPALSDIRRSNWPRSKACSTCCLAALKLSVVAQARRRSGCRRRSLSGAVSPTRICPAPHRAGTRAGYDSAAREHFPARRSQSSH